MIGKAAFRSSRQQGFKPFVAVGELLCRTTEHFTTGFVAQRRQFAAIFAHGTADQPKRQDHRLDMCCHVVGRGRVFIQPGACGYLANATLHRAAEFDDTSTELIHLLLDERNRLCEKHPFRPVAWPR